jgi:hypothetical protein
MPNFQLKNTETAKIRIKAPTGDKGALESYLPADGFSAQASDPHKLGAVIDKDKDGPFLLLTPNTPSSAGIPILVLDGAGNPVPGGNLVVNIVPDDAVRVVFDLEHAERAPKDAPPAPAAPLLDAKPAGSSTDVKSAA